MLALFFAQAGRPCGALKASRAVAQASLRVASLPAAGSISQFQNASGACCGLTCYEFGSCLRSNKSALHEDLREKYSALPVPSTLVSLNSSYGQKLLAGLPEPQQMLYSFVAKNVLTQATETFCGPASACSAVNALRAAAPSSLARPADHAGVNRTARTTEACTQDIFFNSCVDHAASKESVYKQGMSLQAWTQAVECWGAKAEVVYAGKSSQASFRKAASAALKDGRQVVVNFYRRSLQQVGLGHFSPLAAYSAADDRFLLIDVAPYKYPPVWVTTADLFTAMDTTLNEAGLTRGWVVVGLS